MQVTSTYPIPLGILKKFFVFIQSDAFKIINETNF